jgi:hypothetical protein
MLITSSLEICRFDNIAVPSDLTDLSAFGLTDFEFRPHFGNYGGTPEQITKYAGVTVYGAPDGCGLAVIGEELIQHGNILRLG